jgi:hypothetical protein
VNLDGEVVGVNARGAFGASSIGFAIPINIVKEVARDLIGKGKVSRSWIGLTFQPLEELLNTSAGGWKGCDQASTPILPRRGGSAGRDVLFLPESECGAVLRGNTGIYKRIADTPSENVTLDARGGELTGSDDRAGRVQLRRDGLRAGVHRTWNHS